MMKKNEIRVIKMSRQAIVEWLNDSIAEHLEELFDVHTTNNRSCRMIYEDDLDGLTLYLFDNRYLNHLDQVQIYELVENSNCEIIDSLLSDKRYETIFVGRKDGKLRIE